MSRATMVIEAANFYTGRLHVPNLIVVHATSGREDRQESAIGVARYFQRGAPGSTQWVSDDTTDVRCVADADTCWGAKNHNSNGLHFELCGHANWSRERWLAHIPTIHGAAALMAQALRTYKIPFVHPAPIVNGRAQNGVHGHFGLPGNDHTDPAPGPSRRGGFPWDVLLAEIRKRLGTGHTVGTSKPVMAVRSLADIRKRNVVTVRITQRSGVTRTEQGWRDCKDILNYLANGGRLEPSTVVEIAWQGKWFREGQDHMRNIARSIHSRYA